MTPQQLKNSILQFAIQGKLVEQRADEGTAEELYQQIQEEKQKLIKEGKIKKEKTLPEITEDEIPFEIPNSWKWVRLGTIARELNDGVHYAPKYCESGIPCFSAKDIYNFQLNNDRCNYISAEEYQKINDKIKIQSGSLLVTKSGSIGRTCVIEKPFPFGLVESVGVINFTSIFSKYIQYVINTIFYNGSNSEYTNGIGVKHFTLTLISSIKIPLPPLAEQKRIVAKIEELMNLVDEYKDSYEQLVELNKKFPSDIQKSILQYAIQGKLVEQRADEGTAEELYQQIQEEKQKLIKEGKIKKEKTLPEITEDEIPFEIPKSWKWVRFYDIVRFKIGKTPPRAEPEWWSNDIPWVSISDMSDYGKVSTTKEKISIKALNEKFNFISKVGTLLMSFKLTVGRTSILQIDAVHNEAIISIFPLVDENYVFRNYLFYLLPLFAKWGNSNNAIKGKTLNTSSLNEMLIPLPPLAEQKRIVAKIEELMALSNQLKR